MIFYDTHLHSTFSFDSVLGMTRAADRALELGLSGIAFTDHLDVNYLADGSDVYYDFGEYLKAVGCVKNEYEGTLEILSGVEIGLQPHVVSENICRLAGYEFDYKIGSTHLIGRIDPYDGTYFETEPERFSAYRRYLRELITNVELFHDFNTLGHFDYVVRYAPFEDNTIYFREFYDEMKTIIGLMVRYGLAFEVNTRSYDSTPMDLEVLKAFKNAGGETVVLGSDAHSEDRIGRNFKAAAKLVKYCGFDYIAYFRKGLPIYERID